MHVNRGAAHWPDTEQLQGEVRAVADRLDVRDVTDSYRAFQRYEKDLRELNDQFRQLRGIAEIVAAYENSKRDAALARYLEAELRHEHAVELLRGDEEKLAALRGECSKEEARLAELDMLIPKRRAEIDALKNTIGETPDGKLYLELKSRLQVLVAEIQRWSNALGPLQ